MEVRVRERLVGALVLVAIVVLLVPAILKGRAPEPAAAAPESAPVRRIEMPIGDQAPAPEEQVLVPEQLMPEPPPASPTREAQAPDRETPVPSSKTAPPPPEVPEPRSVAKPTVAKSPAQSTPTPNTGPASAWAVQLGAFSNKAKAEQLVAELRKRQFAAFLLEYRASGQVLYRVRVGPEQDRARAEATAARLAKEGFQPVVARHP